MALAKMGVPEETSFHHQDMKAKIHPKGKTVGKYCIAPVLVQSPYLPGSGEMARESIGLTSPLSIKLMRSSSGTTQEMYA